MLLCSGGCVGSPLLRDMGPGAHLIHRYQTHLNLNLICDFFCIAAILPARLQDLTATCLALQIVQHRRRAQHEGAPAV